MSSVGTAWGAIRGFTIDNSLDDTCHVYVNGRYRTTVSPLESMPRLRVGRPNVPGRTSILLRCEDGGVHGTSVEASWDTCDFKVDEEGGGLVGSCY